MRIFSRSLPEKSIDKSSKGKRKIRMDPQQLP
jgi:hypothetical protein